MHMLNRFLVAAAIFSFAFATDGNAAEGPTSRVSATPLQNRNLSKARTELIGFSETTDVDIWLTYGGLSSTKNPHVRVNFANRGTHYAYSRDYVLVFSSADHTWIILEQQTGVLAPNASDSKVFMIPKMFIDNGSVAEVGLFGSDDDPSNDYDLLTLPLVSGI